MTRRRRYRADTLRTIILIGLQQKETDMPALLDLPVIPDTIPVFTTTSNGPDASDLPGYSESEWHCVVTRRPRLGDAKVAVYQPNDRYEPIFAMHPAADVADMDECEEWGELVVRAMLPYLRVLAGDADAWTELRQAMTASDYLRGRIMGDYRARVAAEAVEQRRAKNTWTWEG